MRHFENYPNNSKLTWFQSWDLSWQTDTFHRLVFGKMSITLLTEDIRYGMKSLGIGSYQSVYDESDVEGWTLLTEDAVSLAQKYNDLKELYVQEASLRESQIANY
jgi:hypothetical protein